MSQVESKTKVQILAFLYPPYYWGWDGGYDIEVSNSKLCGCCFPWSSKFETPWKWDSLNFNFDKLGFATLRKWVSFNSNFCKPCFGTLCYTKKNNFQLFSNPIDEKFPAILKEIIENGGYSEDQIFNADECGLWWKLPPTRTITKKCRQTAGLKLQKARSTILLGNYWSSFHYPKVGFQSYVDFCKNPSLLQAV